MVLLQLVSSLTLQIVYIIIAIACWYYPNPDVATSNGVVNVSMTVDTLDKLKALLNEH